MTEPVRYDHLTIEPKWQIKWDAQKIYKCTEDAKFPKEKRFYCLDMFPYPSGAGLHVGHPEGYTASDILCRYKRMQGFNVLHPMGWDAFGLPAENYAIKTGTHPHKSTQANIDNFRKQIKALGFSYDWDREVDTTDPDYYKWTQWIFIQLFKKGLAYEANMPINWCESCKTGLSNEEVNDGKCDRCSGTVVKKNLRQWMLKITAYAERLLDDLDLLDWPEPIKLMQRNWVGKSIGAEVDFDIADSKEKLRIFTTRPDTLYGATYMVIAPEHPLAPQLTTEDRIVEVSEYTEKARQKSDLERSHLQKSKTGIFTGSYAINPVNNSKIPIWISDYVLITYGTGAIMSVPAHDDRDKEFAEKFNLPIIVVIDENNKMINSDKYNGMDAEQFKEAIVADLEKRKIGKKTINYKLRDWVFSRQRYWGEPIPVIHCDKCGKVTVPEDQLPLKLPVVEKYEPTGTGESPLANITEWVNTTCPVCGGLGKRETNTMPQWAGSSWYYMRYIDPKNAQALADKQKLEYWLPVDHYIGGAEHAVLHLLYARFWHKVLYDIGIVSGKEPFQKLTNQGLILAEDGQKMSKSRGNVINPDDVIKEFGADAMRLYEMFMGPLEMTKPWSTKGVVGVKRFLDKAWNILTTKEIVNENNKILDKILHQTIKKVGEDIEALSFNTAISQLMIFSNEAQGQTQIPLETAKTFLILLAPFSPHIAEELWEKLGNKNSIHLEKWPSYDPGLLIETTVNIVFSVNGKPRDTATMAKGQTKEALEKAAMASANVQRHIAGKTIVKKIIIPDKLVNIVIQG